MLTMRNLLAGLGLVVLWADAALAIEANALNAALESIKVADVKRHVQVLADDSFEGREAGSRGGRAVGVYLSEQFKKLKLQPAGQAKGYYQALASGRNILGMLKGSDPKLSQEVVIVSAHYDHVGYGNAQNSLGPVGFIHNGADDNASGVSGLLEVAEAMTLLPTPPKRSVLFILWDGEEKGLLGSQHWVRKPTLPIDRVAVMINLDMIGRLRKDKVEVYGARTAPGLRQLVSQANERAGLTLDYSWELKENSDHYTFFSRGTPVLMFHTGLHDNYHRPSDDVETINPDGIRNVSGLVLKTVIDLADSDKPLRFRETSRTETVDDGTRLASQILAQPPGRLGVRWDPKSSGPGAKISSVRPDSPAAKAGLAIGDRLLELDGQKVINGQSLRAITLAAASPAKAVVLRRGKTVQEPVAIALTGKPIKVGISWRTDDAEPAAVIVTRIVQASPAEDAKLELQDRIYAIDGKSFADAGEFGQLLRSSNGATELLVERQGKLQTLTLKLPEGT